MRKSYALLAPLFLILVLGACVPLKSGVPPCSVPSAQEMADAVNVDRATHGLPLVTVDAELTAMAHGWAAQMASDGLLYHSPLWHRHRWLPGGGSVIASENIAGPGDCYSAAVWEVGWMGSPSHRANILDPDWTRFGGAVVTGADGRTWAVQEFT